MLRRIDFCRIIALLLIVPASGLAQSVSKRPTVSASPAPVATPTNPYAGMWTYRSYVNRPDVIVGNDPQKALDLVFGEGIITFDIPVVTALKGTLDLGGGYILDLNGTILGEPSMAPPVLHISGIGRPGTPTAGWDYEYVGYLAYTWPNGTAQVPAIVGTVVRAKPHDHDQAKAGFVASFIATKQQ
jgi:hypothetical protein